VQRVGVPVMRVGDPETRVGVPVIMDFVLRNGLIGVRLV